MIKNYHIVLPVKESIVSLDVTTQVNISENFDDSFFRFVP